MVAKQLTLGGESRILIEAKPFMKWAGGKGQLLPSLEQRLPGEIQRQKVIENYVEPFVGGGAFFFYLKKHFNVKNSVIADINPELYLTYRVIQEDYTALIMQLKELETHYLTLKEDARREYFYKVRETFNKQLGKFNFNIYSDKWIERASHILFLNKTCFNGLFRQNSKGEFNVPFGHYKNPKICNRKVIESAHAALQHTVIINDDFESVEEYVYKGTVVYFDPPYRPLNQTSSFNGYSKDGFNDEDQRRLANFYRHLDLKGAFLILSNSDPKNERPDDEFFDDIYKDFTLERVQAKRMINCNATKRGEITELIVRNYGG